MRGGDGGGGVSALEPHLAHTCNEQHPGRPPRRSGRTQNASLAVNGNRVDSHPSARAEGVRTGYLGNVTTLPSTDPEGSGMTTLRGGGEESVRATMRGGDGAAGGLSALESQHAGDSSDELRRGARRVRVESNQKRGRDGPARNGVQVNVSAASSSRRVEPAAPRFSRGGGSTSGGRKRTRSNRSVNGVAETNGMANGSHENNLMVQKHGKSRINMVGPFVVEEDQVEPEVFIRERVGEYFPLVPDELGMQCLQRLPRHRIYEMAMVCKKWREYLLGPDFYKSRRSLGVREDWVFILGTNNDKNWRAFRPDVGDWVSIPSCPSDYTFDSCDKESMVAGLNLLVLGQNKDGYVIWKFDTINFKWSTTPRMRTDRCMFGSATFGKYAYFAGGTSRARVLKSVERYDSETNTWEALAEMNHDRKACSGFVMDGKFHVIGGHVATNILSSGEAYDPQTGKWTVIEEMWPQQFVPNTQVSPPLVAVLNDQLYAINIIHNMLMLYDKQNNSWQMLGKVPHRAENTNGWGLGFKSVGDELFVIGGARGPGQFLPKIHAYKPRADGGETWRHVTDLKIPTNGFIYNCAVMSG